MNESGRRIASEVDDRDVADLLYQNGVGTPALTCIAAGFMIAILPTARALDPVGLAVWFGAHVVIAAVRAVDIMRSKQRRRKPDWSGRAEILRYGAGVVASSVAWGAFPLLFFHDLDAGGRSTMATVLCILTGGSAAILGASPPLAVIFAAGALLPSSVLFLRAPGSENTLLGFGGFIFFALAVLLAALTHRGTMAAIRIARANERLNRELTSTQAALRESLETLEERIKERTADLEVEVRERERYSVELARLAMHDSLTGLYNRGTLAQKLLDVLDEAKRVCDPVAVLFLDLDKFKEVNDLHGHHAGDQVLREIVTRMTAIVPGDAMLARWGGDEFVFVHRASEASEAAEAVGERLRRSISTAIVVGGGETVNVGATIGIAVYPDHGATPDELIRAADMAMYTAKQDGRGQIRTFDQSMANALGRRHHLEQALHEAIASRALRLEFQPVVDAATRRCTSLEALLRWDSPAFGTVPPSEFIPLAERTGEINPIGRWVLDHACLAAASWPGNAAPAVSVNVSVAQIASGNLLDDVRGAIASSGLDPQRLRIEVTETLFASDHELTIPTLEALRAMGIRISLDDFGTGFSSLSYLGRCRSTRSKSTSRSSTTSPAVRARSSRRSSRSRARSASRSSPKAWKPRSRPRC